MQLQEIAHVEDDDPYYGGEDVDDDPRDGTEITFSFGN